MNYRCAILVLLLAGLSSCSRSDCEKPSVNAVTIDSTGDFMALVLECEKGSNYTKIIDSSRILISYNDNSHPARGHFNYLFSNTDAEYLIQLQPSGSQHTVTNLSFGSEKGKLGQSTDRLTYCSCGFSVDGVPVSYGSIISGQNFEDFGIEVAR